MFVVLSGQMKYGSIERREYQAIALPSPAGKRR
jgi:hypothetical protein